MARDLAKVLIGALPWSSVISAVMIWVGYIYCVEQGNALSTWIWVRPVTWFFMLWVPVIIAASTLAAWFYRLVENHVDAGAVGFVAAEISVINLFWLTVGYKYVIYLART